MNEMLGSLITLTIFLTREPSARDAYKLVESSEHKFLRARAFIFFQELL